MTVSLKKISIMLAASALMFLSCKSMDPTLVTQTASFDSGVPPMRVVVNTESIRSCFPGGWLDHNGMIAVMNRRAEEISRGRTGLEPQHFQCCSFSDQEAAVRIIRNNLAFGRNAGNVYLSVVVRNVEWYKNYGWMANWIALNILCFMGIPYSSSTLTVELEAAVMKPDGRVLRLYRVRGIDTEYCAMYWGYRDPTVPALRYALIDGCAKIRRQMEDDKENLNKIIR